MKHKTRKKKKGLNPNLARAIAAKARAALDARTLLASSSAGRRGSPELAFLAAYAAALGDGGAAVPSDLRAISEACVALRARRLPTYFAVPIAWAKLGPAVADMLASLSGEQRPSWRNKGANQAWITSAAIDASLRHRARMDVGDADIKVWTSHYAQQGRGMLGPTAPGERDGPKRKRYFNVIKALVRDRALHALLTDLADGVASRKALREIVRRVVALMPPTCEYIAPWLARAVIYGLGSSADFQAELILDRLVDRGDFLAEDETALFRAVPAARVFKLFHKSSKLLASVHLCHAETVAGYFPSLPKATAFLKRHRAAVATQLEAHRSETGVELPPWKVVKALLAEKAA